MEKIEKSGYCYANRFSLVMLESLEDILGKNGLKAILNLARLPGLVENYPPDNLEKAFDFADVAATLRALEETYGLKGGRGLVLRAGRAVFSSALKGFGVMAGVEAPEFKALPVQIRTRIGLRGLAQVLTQISDQQIKVEEQEDGFLFSVHRCPSCWGRTGADQPVCYLYVGILQEGIEWITGSKDCSVKEVKCAAQSSPSGSPACEFLIQGPG